jgi:hypothetical protein
VLGHVERDRRDRPVLGGDRRGDVAHVRDRLVVGLGVAPLADLGQQRPQLVRVDDRRRREPAQGRREQGVDLGVGQVGEHRLAGRRGVHGQRAAERGRVDEPDRLGAVEALDQHHRVALGHPEPHLLLGGLREPQHHRAGHLAQRAPLAGPAADDRAPQRQRPRALVAAVEPAADLERLQRPLDGRLGDVEHPRQLADADRLVVAHRFEDAERGEHVGHG